MKDEKIGAKIKALRKENKDTLKSLAEKIEYDYSNLSKVERGVYSASTELLRKIIDVYNVNPNYFFEEFTEGEGRFLLDVENDPSELKKKYKFEKEGVEATEEEILEALRLIRFLKQQNR